jgi:Family of unknown function (DUF6206)
VSVDAGPGAVGDVRPSADAPTAAASAPADAELGELEGLVEEALAAGTESQLAVLGFGEISLVLAWPQDRPRFACKRLPVFGDRGRFERYRQTLEAYLEALRAAGVDPIDSTLRPMEHEDGTVAGYVVQPILPSETLAPNVLAEADPGRGHPLVAAVVATAAGAVGPRLGLDAQLSNWAFQGDRLTYLDVTTPMLWSADGRALLDIDLLVRPIPWLLRGAIKRLLAPRILDGYRSLSGVYSDLCGNLLKEGLEYWLPAFLKQANRHLEQPMSVADVHKYYRSDARLWALLLRIRRLDRAWQRHVRHRPYPFLLPRETER